MKKGNFCKGYRFPGRSGFCTQLAAGFHRSKRSESLQEFGQVQAALGLQALQDNRTQQLMVQRVPEANKSDPRHWRPSRSCPEPTRTQVPNMKLYIDFVGSLQNSGFWLVRV